MGYTSDYEDPCFILRNATFRNEPSLMCIDVTTQIHFVKDNYISYRFGQEYRGVMNNTSDGEKSCFIFRKSLRL